MATRILIVESPYYQEIAEELAKGAIAALNGANTEVDRVSVPGALEIPPAIAMASETDRYDGFVALGCVIRGETSHYDIVANECARALMALNLEGLAIGNGILTCDTGEQAKMRADAAGKNKGADAANAALALIKVREDMSRGE